MAVDYVKAGPLVVYLLKRLAISLHPIQSTHLSLIPSETSETPYIAEPSVEKLSRHRISFCHFASQIGHYQLQSLSFLGGVSRNAIEIKARARGLARDGSVLFRSFLFHGTVRFRPGTGRFLAVPYDMADTRQKSRPTRPSLQAHWIPLRWSAKAK